jgi:hypothetical protein
MHACSYQGLQPEVYRGDCEAHAYCLAFNAPLYYTT